MQDSGYKRVFISYARKDGAELAQRLEQDLTAEKFEVRLDQRRIRGGASWTVDIELEIDRAQVVLALLSPGSFKSDICRAEQLRSLRKAKHVIPLLAQNGTDVPLHLETKNYRDFTRSEAYTSQLRLLVEDIQAGRNAVELRPEFRATYVTAPPLPRNYLKRSGALSNLRDVVLTDEPGPSIALTALRGMGGIGKTVLAQALTHDEAVQQAFPDGIAWTTVGNEPTHSLIVRMQEVRRALGDEPAKEEPEIQCINRYRTILREKAALVIVDDVWRTEDIEPFLAESPRSRVLFTTRDSSIASATGASEHTADLLTVEQSRALLARSAGFTPENLPPESVNLVKECGCLPLALAMIGAMLRGKPAAYWAHVLKVLKEADLEKIRARFPGYPHADMLRAIEVSVDALASSDRERYLSLAVLLEDIAIAPAVQQTLWKADLGEALETAERFVSLSLAQRDGDAVRLHDLQLDYVRSEYPEQESLGLIHGAVQLSSHIIRNDPRQFASQIVGRLLPHRDAPGIARFIGRIAAGAPAPWIQPLQPALHPPGTPLVRTLEGHSDVVNGVAVSPDGRRAVSASEDSTLKVWDLESGHVLRTLEGHSGSVNGVALSPDGRTAVSASNDKALKVWDLESGQILRTLEGHSGAVFGVAVSPDGRRAVSPSTDGTLKMWDLESGQMLRTLEGHSGYVNGVAVSPDGGRAVSASDDTLKVWDLESGHVLRTLEGHSAPVIGVAVSPDGRRAVSASWDKTLKVWDPESGQMLRTLEGHSGYVNGVAVSPDGRRAVSASSDKTLRVWDLESGQVLRTLEGHSAAVFGVAVSRDGRRVVSASWDKTLKVWDLESGQVLRTLEGHSGIVRLVAVSPDWRRAVSASSDKTLRVWDLESGQILRTFEGHSDWINGLAVGPDGRRAVSASGKTPEVWDLESGQVLRTLEGHSGAVFGVAVSPDGRRAVSASGDKTLKVWDLESGQVLRTLEGHSDSVTGVAVSPDWRRAVSASGDKTLKVWDLESGQVLRTLEGHARTVFGVAVSPDGRRAVSAAWDDPLKVWDLESGQMLRTLEGHSDRVNGVAVSPDGRRAVSASDDKTLKVWDLDSGVPVCTFTCDGPAECCTFANDRKLIAGDAGGRVHFLRLEL